MSQVLQTQHSATDHGMRSLWRHKNFAQGKEDLVPYFTVYCPRNFIFPMRITFTTTTYLRLAKCHSIISRRLLLTHSKTGAWTRTTVRIESFQLFQIANCVIFILHREMRRPRSLIPCLLSGCHHTNLATSRYRNTQYS